MNGREYHPSQIERGEKEGNCVESAYYGLFAGERVRRYSRRQSIPQSNQNRQSHG
jgi:hypothetical protein